MSSPTRSLTSQPRSAASESSFSEAQSQGSTFLHPSNLTPKTPSTTPPPFSPMIAPSGESLSSSPTRMSFGDSLDYQQHCNSYEDHRGSKHRPPNLQVVPAYGVPHLQQSEPHSAIGSPYLNFGYPCQPQTGLDSGTPSEPGRSPHSLFYPGFSGQEQEWPKTMQSPMLSSYHNSPILTGSASPTATGAMGPALGNPYGVENNHSASTQLLYSGTQVNFEEAEPSSSDCRV
ncbi:hypothetical protein PQX77_004095 [Marasmius sp. AFHP31]|nr:hypothetical protein PQX77_004095 [Marasmius sp. AFHP31]